MITEGRVGLVRLLRTARVVLQRPARDGWSEFSEFIAQSRSLHALWVDPPSDADAFSTWVQHCDSPRHESFLVRLGVGGPIAGVVSLYEISRLTEPNANLGFYASVHYTGRGYIGEAVDRLLQHGSSLGLARIFADVHPDNEPSRRILRRSGFGPSGDPPQLLRAGGRWSEHERWVRQRGELRRNELERF